MMLAASGLGPLSAALDPVPAAQLRPAYCIRRAPVWHIQRRRPTAAAAGSGDSYKSPPSDLRDALPTANLDMAASGFAKGEFGAHELQHTRPILTQFSCIIAAGAADGTDADDLVAQQLGAGSASQLTDTQDRYKDKIKAKLEERAEELRREREARAAKFTAGKAAYARGQYPTSVTLLEAALEEAGPFSQLGGEVQMWLALAYQACGREEDCIAMYKTVEKTHPVPAIRRKAAGLRYIMEAPKLELGADEKVSIPVLTDLDPNRGGRAPPPRPRVQPRQEKPKTWDEEFWANYEPPKYMRSKYVWVAAAAVTAWLAWYSAGLRP